MIPHRQMHCCLHPVVSLMVCLTCLAASPAAIAGPAPARLGEEDFASLSARLSTLDERLGQARQAVDRMQQTLDTLPRATDEDPAMAAERLAVTRKLIEDERQTLARLVAANSQLPESLSLAELEARQRDSETERDTLVKQLEALNDPKTDQAAGYGSSRRMEGKTLVPLVVTKGRLVPAVEPYFSVRETPCFNRVTREQLTCAEIKRVRDGTAVSIAIRDGDLLDTLIKDRGLTPESAIFFLNVCADSIESFFKLSRAIKARGHSFAWTTFRDRPVLRPLDGSTDSEPGVVDGY